MPLSSEIKNGCLLSRISVWEKLGVLAMFGFLLKAKEKTRKPAAARALSTGALAAVQPRKWARLELTLSNEKKHRHRHTRWAKKALTTTQHSHILSRRSACTVCCACCSDPGKNCKHDGRIRKRIRTVAFEIRDYLFFILNPHPHTPRLISKLLLERVNRFWDF